jgi:hypothetical protein
VTNSRMMVRTCVDWQMRGRVCTTDGQGALGEERERQRVKEEKEGLMQAGRSEGEVA